MNHCISKLHVPDYYRANCNYRHNKVCYGTWLKILQGKLICPNPECPGRDDEWSKKGGV
jgi:hypothetical protein